MKEQKVTQVQLFTFLLSSMVGAGIINLPAVLAKVTHQDAWISSLIGGLFPLLLINIGLTLFKAYPNQNILDMGVTLLGPILGKLLSFLIMIYLYLVTGFSVRISVDFISSWILPTTPIEIMIILFIVSSIYLARGGLFSLIRFAEITALVLLPFFIIILIPLREWRLLNMLPVLSQPVSAYFASALHSAFPYLGFELILFVAPFTQLGYKKLRFGTNLGVIFVILIYTLFTLAAILTFGHVYVEKQIYTAIKYIQLLYLPVVERLEFTIIFFWIFALFTVFSLFYFFAYQSFKFTFPIKSSLWILLFSVPIYFIALYPQSFPEVNAMAEIVSIFAISVITFVIFTLKLVSLFKRRSTGG